MKRIIACILVIILGATLAACEGNFAEIDINEPIPLPENGVVDHKLLDQIKEDNAIATFTGTSCGMDYEWTVFGSDLTETRDVNLSVELEKTEEGILLTFAEREKLGFSALLSVCLNDKWSADSATAFAQGQAIYSVSITGSKTSILNLSVDKMVESCEILPDVSLMAEVLPESEPRGEEEPSSGETTQEEIPVVDEYLSAVTESDSRVYSDGKSKNQDKYKTDPVPEGKPLPVEPENQEVNKKKTYTCTFSIECSTILNNLEDLNPDKRSIVPSNGVILSPTKVTFYEGESVYDVLQRVCREKGIHMESSWTPIYNSAYIEGIHNLYEFDCGALSGWMYRVDGWYPNYGCSRYQLKDGERVEWRYTCDLGNDVGRTGSW